MHVNCPSGDYAANHSAAIADGRLPPDTPAPQVVRFESILLCCRGIGGHLFTASFDEIQRTISCPECLAEVFVPEAYRGMP